MLGMLTRQLKALDLRFECKDQEASFLQSLEPDILSSSLICFLVLAICLFLASCFYALQGLREGLPLVDIGDPRLVTILANLAFSLLSGSTSACVWARQRWGLFKSMDWETLLLTHMTLAGITTIFANRRTSALLQGQEPSQLWGVNADAAISNVPLLINLFVMYTCIFSMVRVHRVWLMPMLLVALLTAEYARQGWLLTQVSTPILVTVTSCFLLRSAWLSERSSRAKWELARLAKEQARIMHFQSQEIHENQVEMGEQKKQIEEQMHGVLVELPGIVAGPLPSTYGKAVQRGPSRQSSRVSRNRRGNANGALDGQWRLQDAPPNIANWLRFLNIAGARVIDGAGDVCRLHEDAEGITWLENGTLSLEGENLVRIGRTSRQSFARMPENGNEDDDEDDHSDRESTIDVVERFVGP